MKNKNEEAIDRLVELEQKGRAVFNRLTAIETRWERVYEKVKNTDEWKAYCERTGSADRYSFRDVLA